MIFCCFIDFGHFLIEIPIEVQKNYGQRKEWSYSENKKCSEICEQNGTTWNHVEVEVSTFIKIRITLTIQSARVLQKAREKPTVGGKTAQKSNYFQLCICKIIDIQNLRKIIEKLSLSKNLTPTPTYKSYFLLLTRGRSSKLGQPWCPPVVMFIPKLTQGYSNNQMIR